MLGDNPLYTPTSIYNLHILFSADYVICPDSMWRDQLTQMGVKNAVFDCFGFNSSACSDGCFGIEPGAVRLRPDLRGRRQRNKLGVQAHVVP